MKTLRTVPGTVEKLTGATRTLNNFISRKRHNTKIKDFDYQQWFIVNPTLDSVVQWITRTPRNCNLQRGF